MRFSLAVVLLALAAPAPLSLTARASAQATGEATAAPERRAPRASRHRRSRPSVLARSVGFRMNPDGTSRCSVHVSAELTPTSSASRRRFEVTLPGAAPASRNDLHPLETEFFNTPMRRAHLVRRGRDLVLVVDLRDDVTPTLRVEADPNGGIVVIVDLPAGHYVDGPPTIGDASVRLSDEPERASGGSDDGRSRGTSDRAQPAPSTAAPARGGHDDAERPPAFGN